MKKILLVLTALFLVTACSAGSKGSSINGKLNEGAMVSDLTLTEKDGKVVSAKEVTSIEMSEDEFAADYSDMYKQFSAFKSDDESSSFAYEYKDGKAVITVTVDFTVVPAVNPDAHLYSKLTTNGTSIILTTPEVDMSTEAVKTLLTDAGFEF